MKEPSIKFSKEILKDMTLIANYNSIKLSDWIKRLNTNFEILIQEKKAFTIKKLEGLWVLDKMTDDLKPLLITKNMEFELKIIELEHEYKRKHKEVDEKKMEKFVNSKLKKEIQELLQLNINPTIKLLNSV